MVKQSGDEAAARRTVARISDAHLCAAGRRLCLCLRRTSEYVEGLSDARTQGRLFLHLLSAEVVEWQTRTFEGRVAKAVRVQVPPSAPSIYTFPTGF